MSKLVFYLRTGLYSTLLLGVSFVSLIIAPVATVLGKRLNVNYYVARTFWHVTGPLLGWKFVVEGEGYLWAGQGERKNKDERSAVMVGNHQSFVDILYLGRIFPKHAAIMAKKSIRLVPGLGQWMMMSGTVFINRSNNKSATASMTQAGEDMKRRRISLWMFPEGTRHMSPEPELLPFKKGAFYLAVQSGVPIIPVVCQNYHHLYDGKSHFRSGTLRIRVLPPIPTDGLTVSDVPALMEKTRDLMLETLQELSQPDSPIGTVPASSPTPLLADSSSRQHDGYFSNASIDTDYPADDKSSTEELEGAVVGMGTGRSSGSMSSGAQSQGRRRSREGKSREANGSASGEATQGSRQAQAQAKGQERRQLAIAMVSDFFLPIVGGVEGHIAALGIELVRRGHRVIVITHSVPPRTGIRHLGPLKVYYLPILPIASQATLPNFLLFLPYLRNILVRESIDLVHAHGSLSSLGHEALYHAPLLGVRTVFTDHSLFGFGDAVGILTNKLLAGALRTCDEVICVSNTGRENTVLRAEIEPDRVSVIPNALEAEDFTPDPSRASEDHITIVVISRLVYRKGIDLLVASAPQICELFPDVRFVVGGDGPKMVDLEQMREKYQLQDRIELLGSIPPTQVRDVLTRGQIYLNTSLTEAFGISIIEAASAGLFVVSTRVGGVPEILPGDMIEFARADEDDVIRALSHAIAVIRAGSHSPLAAHHRVKGMYAWSAVAQRTEAVYYRALASPAKDTAERLSAVLALGHVYGPILCVIMAVQHWFFWVLEVVAPRDEVDLVKHHWTHEGLVREVEREKASLTSRHAAVMRDDEEVDQLL